MKFRSKMSMLISASILALGAANGALAQEANSDDASDEDVAVLDTVTVRGYAKSLQEARDLKRASAQFIDAIIADDIGKLPDNNVAESLQRVSGVQLERGQGEGTSVQIRGLNQNVVLVNGRQITPGDGRGSNGPDTLGTSTYSLLSLVPSQLISQLQVEKQSASDQIEGALGGTINIVTRKPLDANTPRFAGSIGTVYKELPDSYGYQAFGLASHKNAAETFGVLLAGSIIQQDVQEDGFQTFSSFDDLGRNTLFDPSGAPLSTDPNGDGIDGIHHIDPRYWRISDDRTRYGINGIVQWRPSAQTEVMFDSFYSRTESERDRHWLGTFARGTYTNAVVSPNEVLLAGQINRSVNTNAEYQDNFHEIWSNALSVTHEVNDDISLFGEIAYTRSEQYLDRTFFRLQNPSNTIPVALDLRPDFPTFGGADGTFASTVNDPNELQLRIFFDTDSGSVVDDLALRFDADLGDNLEVGMRYQNIELDRDNTGRSTQSLPGSQRPRIDTGLLGDLVVPFSFGSDYLDGEAASTPRNFVTIRRELNCLPLVALDDANDAVLNDASRAECLRDTQNEEDSYVLDETFWSAYLKYNYETEVMGLPISGNIGMRYVDRELVATGVLTQDDGSGGVLFTPLTETVESSELFPSAVAKIDLNENKVLRLGVARALAYPNTDDLNPATDVDGTGLSGTGGSPRLEPFLVNQVDAALEYYYGDEGLLSLGVFHKDVESFIVEEVNAETVPGFANPIDITRNRNGEGGSITGLEVLWQQSLGDWMPALDGFGFSSSYSFITSETEEEDRFGNELGIPGLSENNLNLIGYYEKGPFGARIALNWRDEFYNTIDNTSTAIFFDSYTDLAASARYDINENFSVDFDAVNLLDTELRTYNGFEEATNSNVLFGRTFKVTLRGTF